MSERQLVISVDYGSPWVTATAVVAEMKFRLTYQPFIETLVAGQAPDYESFEHDFQAVFGRSSGVCWPVCTVGLIYATGRVRVHEYDGLEHIEEEGEYTEWL